MSVGEALVEALRGAPPGPVEVDVQGFQASVDVVGSGPYGAEVRGLRIRGGSRDVEAVVDAIAERVTYLPERLERFEVDAASGRGLLRSAREQVRDREYYEVEATPGQVDFGRFRFTEPGARATLGENFGHRDVRRLVDDLCDILGG